MYQFCWDYYVGYLGGDFVICLQNMTLFNIENLMPASSCRSVPGASVLSNTWILRTAVYFSYKIIKFWIQLYIILCTKNNVTGVAVKSGSKDQCYWCTCLSFVGTNKHTSKQAPRRQKVVVFDYRTLWWLSCCFSTECGYPTKIDRIWVSTNISLNSP